MSQKLNYTGDIKILGQAATGFLCDPDGFPDDFLTMSQTEQIEYLQEYNASDIDNEGELWDAITITADNLARFIDRHYVAKKDKAFYVLSGWASNLTDQEGYLREFPDDTKFVMSVYQVDNYSMAQRQFQNDFHRQCGEDADIDYNHALRCETEPEILN